MDRDLLLQHLRHAVGRKLHTDAAGHSSLPVASAAKGSTLAEARSGVGLRGVHLLTRGDFLDTEEVRGRGEVDITAHGVHAAVLAPAAAITTDAADVTAIPASPLAAVEHAGPTPLCDPGDVVFAALMFLFNDVEVDVRDFGAAAIVLHRTVRAPTAQRASERRRRHEVDLGEHVGTSGASHLVVGDSEDLSLLLSIEDVGSHLSARNLS